MVRARARRTDPATSHESAASVAVSRGHAAVLRALIDLGTATDEQILAYCYEHSLKISPSGCRSRRSELTREGWIMDSGWRQRTGTGRRSIVWGLVHGREFYLDAIRRYL